MSSDRIDLQARDKPFIEAYHDENSEVSTDNGLTDESFASSRSSSQDLPDGEEETVVHEAGLQSAVGFSSTHLGQGKSVKATWKRFLILSLASLMMFGTYYFFDQASATETEIRHRFGRKLGKCTKNSTH
jgi:hypothetical protein